VILPAFGSCFLCCRIQSTVILCAGFSVEGPSQTEVQCRDDDDGCAAVTYLAPVAGQYAVHVLCNDEDITDSPFIVQVHPPPATNFDPSKVFHSADLVLSAIHLITLPQEGCKVF